MDIAKLKSVYFLGIGGIGMSGLARYLHSQGIRVSGYDRTKTSLTSKLTAEGMDIHYEDDPVQIPPDTDLVIYTPAIPRENREFGFITENGLPLIKRAEMLGLISKDHQTIAVAGTHGKTTTSTMIAHIFNVAGRRFTAFLGGISKNYQRNYITGPGGKPDNNSPDAGERLFIVEADEYDRSFLHLSPDCAVITSADADHLDIYKSHKNLLASFSEFIKCIKPDGKLVIKAGVELANDQTGIPHRYTYSLDPTGEFHCTNVRIEEINTAFDLITPDGTIRDIVLGTPGNFNLENAIAASAVALLQDIPEGDLKKALRTFQGVERRFDVQIKRDDFVYIDDYAHHPAELTSCIQAVRQIFPGKRITGIFQPHLFSRTRDLANEFSRSLELLDDLILLEIYPARENPIEGINAEMLLEKVRLRSKLICSKEDVFNALLSLKPEILLTLGAGDIDQMVPKINKFYHSDERLK